MERGVQRAQDDAVALHWEEVRKMAGGCSSHEEKQPLKKCQLLH